MPGWVKLEVTGGPMKGKSFTFEQHDTLLVGRDTECHVRLDERDTTASRQHFILEVNPPDVRVRDFGSLNATLVNGKAIGHRDLGETAEQGRAKQFPQVDLRNGDELRAGGSAFKVHTEVPAHCAVCNSAIDSAQKAACRTKAGVFVCGPCRARLAAEKTELPQEAAPVVCKQCGKDVAAEVGEGRRGDYVCATCQAAAANDPIAILVKEIAEQLQQRGEKPAGDGIPGYRTQKLLGAGGMGAVYLARRDADGKHVAIKVMLAKVATSQKMRDMFKREIDLTQKVRHPNVVSLLDHGSAGSGFYFVMDYHPLGSVDALMSKHGGKLPLDVAMPLAMSALEGLAFLHDSSLVHRDLKPANLLVSAVGVAKVSDLGLAKNFDQAGLSGMTVTGAVAGTAAFMPREQITNFKRVKPATDVFSFAATLYNMITGELPRDFTAAADPMHVVLRGPIVPIRQRDSRIPARVAEVIDRGCAADAKDRYATGRELRDALARALQGGFA